MFLAEFGKKVRKIREEQKITREDFCGDEADLSVRQLARIEAGQCVPNLNKVIYISKQLHVSIGELTDGRSFELPTRYKELKYQILRIPVYTDEEKIKIREAQFDEIAEYFYDELPEEEKLIVDCLQSILDTMNTQTIDFGAGLLEEYLEQMKLKIQYEINDLILLHLYLMCATLSDDVYDGQFVVDLPSRLLKRLEYYTSDELLVLSKVLVNLFSLHFEKKCTEQLEELLDVITFVMNKTQDFNKLPIVKLLEWKYSLFYLQNAERARICFEQAYSFAGLINDDYLIQQLQSEWKKDTVPQ